MADLSGLSRVKGESQEGKRGEKRSERIPFGQRREGKEEIATSWWKCGRVSLFKPGHKSANSSHSDLDLVFDMMCVLKIKGKKKKIFALLLAKDVPPQTRNPRLRMQVCAEGVTWT